jgi:hypothetical protein
VFKEITKITRAWTAEDAAFQVELAERWNCDRAIGVELGRFIGVCVVAPEVN